MRPGLVILLVVLCSSPLAAQPPAAVSAGGPGMRARSGAELRVLLAETAGPLSSLEIVELTLPPDPTDRAAEHRHGSAELIYVLSGRLDHIVNGTPHRLEPGALGIVRPGDRVRHRVVGDEPVRALVVWAPAGELARLRAAFGDTVAPPIDTPADEEIAALRAAWTQAYEDADVERMRDLYTDGAVRMPYNGIAQQGRDAILEGYRQSFASRRLEPEIALIATEVRYSGDMIMERGTYRELLTPVTGGRTLLELGKYVSLLRRGTDGRWRYHWSIFNADAPAAPVGVGGT